MAFRSTAAELTRQYKQNRNDIEALHDLLEKTAKKVETTETKVDELITDVDNVKTDISYLKADVGSLKTDVGSLKSDVGSLKTDVGSLTTRVDGLDDKVDRLSAHVDARFDRLEQLIALPSAEREAATENPMRTQQEKKISLLETKMEIYSRRTSDHIEELKRHNQIFDVYDQRFTRLDSQMAEVLDILRAKSA